MPIEPVTHRTIAVEANNSVWEILGKPVAEIDEFGAEEMTQRAYAAAYHWARAEGSTVANEARAEWLLSRVWAVRGNGALALSHARRCMEACERGSLLDFDLAYAHESLARAQACLGNREAAQQHRAAAAAVPIGDDEDRAVVESDLAAEPWFGL